MCIVYFWIKHVANDLTLLLKVYKSTKIWRENLLNFNQRHPFDFDIFFCVVRIFQAYMLLSPISQNHTEFQCICKLDFGKVLWNWLYMHTKFKLCSYINDTDCTKGFSENCFFYGVPLKTIKHFYHLWNLIFTHFTNCCMTIKLFFCKKNLFVLRWTWIFGCVRRGRPDQNMK